MGVCRRHHSHHHYHPPHACVSRFRGFALCRTSSLTLAPDVTPVVVAARVSSPSEEPAGWRPRLRTIPRHPSTLPRDQSILIIPARSSIRTRGTTVSRKGSISSNLPTHTSQLARIPRQMHIPPTAPRHLQTQMTPCMPRLTDLLRSASKGGATDTTSRAG